MFVGSFAQSLYALSGSCKLFYIECKPRLDQHACKLLSGYFIGDNRRNLILVYRTAKTGRLLVESGSRRDGHHGYNTVTFCHATFDAISEIAQYDKSYEESWISYGPHIQPKLNRRITTLDLCYRIERKEGGNKYLFSCAANPPFAKSARHYEGTYARSAKDDVLKIAHDRMTRFDKKVSALEEESL